MAEDDDDIGERFFNQFKRMVDLAERYVVAFEEQVKLGKEALDRQYEQMEKMRATMED